MRLLFFKEAFAWPRAKGHDVHCFHMMRALIELGHEVSVVTLTPPPTEALQGLRLTSCRVLNNAVSNGSPPPLSLTRSQERFRSYWGIEPTAIHGVADAARACEAETVVAVGLSVLPYLGAVTGARRVWYAADEWAWHHWSQLRFLKPATWGELRAAFIKGVYERVYGQLLDRVWVVTEADRRAMRWVAGIRKVDVIPNGVDAEHYRPRSKEQIKNSCVFWGRLDFGPNLQALEWFLHRVWPSVRHAVPDAKFNIFGFNPGAAILDWSGREGVQVVGDLPDLRGEVDRFAVAVLPFVSGGGIKNKLLEAASLGQAIVCSPQACGGLRLPAQPPFLLARRPAEWIAHLQSLWQDAPRRSALGTQAREWVRQHHTWQAAAREAIAGLTGADGPC